VASDLRRPAAPQMLSWAIKDSFLAYVRRSAGTITLVAPARPGDSGFEFPLLQPPAGGRLSFGGGVACTAHGGMLDVVFAEPVLCFEDDGGWLVLGDRRDPFDPALRSRIARLAPETPSAAPSGAVALRAQLTDAGSALFGGVYPAGAELDPLHVSAELVTAARR
jgi:Htaa protein